MAIEIQQAGGAPLIAGLAQLAGEAETAKRQEEYNQRALEQARAFAQQKKLREIDAFYDMQKYIAAKDFELFKMKTASELDFARDEKKRQDELNDVQAASKQVDKAVREGQYSAEEGDKLKLTLLAGQAGTSLASTLFPKGVGGGLGDLLKRTTAAAGGAGMVTGATTGVPPVGEQPSAAATGPEVGPQTIEAIVPMDKVEQLRPFGYEVVMQTGDGRAVVQRVNTPTAKTATQIMGEKYASGLQGLRNIFTDLLTGTPQQQSAAWQKYEAGVNRGVDQAVERVGAAGAAVARPLARKVRSRLADVAEFRKEEDAKKRRAVEEKQTAAAEKKQTGRQEKQLRRKEAKEDYEARLLRTPWYKLTVTEAADKRKLLRRIEDATPKRKLFDWRYVLGKQTPGRGGK